MQKYIFHFQKDLKLLVIKIYTWNGTKQIKREHKGSAFRKK